MQLKLKDKQIIDLTYPQVMGILNMTPDSFSDGGDHNNLDAALRQVEKMVQEGATFIDVGGESTRPNANEVSLDEELSRVVPIVEKIASYFEVWISVDTSKAEVMRESINVGAHIINDVRSLTEPNALETASDLQVPVCVMHMLGTPKTMLSFINDYQHPIEQEVDQFFTQHIQRYVDAGIQYDHILLDPGFGFSKSIQDSYRLLSHLEDFHHFNLPLFVGMSRKGMIGQVLNVPPKERIYGSVSCAVIAAMKGAKIVRVHDVKATVDALRIVQAVHNNHK